MLHLNDELTEGMIATFWDYGCRYVAYGKIIFNRVQQKRMISLKDRVKDKVRPKPLETSSLKPLRKHQNSKNAASTRKRQVNH